MKEFFEKRKFTGTIDIALPQENVPKALWRHWRIDKAMLCQNIVNVVEDFYNQGYILSLRQLYYQLVKANLIPNNDTVYKKIGTLKDDLCYAGRIDWEMIEDRGRKPVFPYTNKDAKDALEDALRQFRLNLMRTQSNTIELWTEKDAVSGILGPVASQYCVRFSVNKGYTSSSAIYRTYLRVANAIERERKFILLYFGDHDPSGVDMVRDIKERLEFMLENGEFRYAQWQIREYLRVVRIGLDKTQIVKFHLPPNPAKIRDPRAAAYIRTHGNTSWELDALTPQQMVAIATQGIEAFYDEDEFKKMRKLEAKYRKELKLIVDNYKQ